MKARTILFLLTIHYLLLTINCYPQPVQQEWVRRFNDTSSAAWQAFSVKSDSMGFIYVLAGPGLTFGFLKYNSNGNLLVNVSYWPGGYSFGGGRYFDVAPNGDVYITGSVDQNPYYWIYTVKFNSSGVFQWGRLYNPDNIDGVHDIKIGNAGNVIIVGGATIGNIDYALTIEYNSNGDTLWTRRFNQPPNYPALNNKVDLDNSNNIYTTGSIIRPGIPGKCLILKYNSSGNLQWFNTFTIDSTRSNGGQGICLDAFGNIYVIGTQSLAPYGYIYIYLLRMSNAGAILWNRLYPIPLVNGAGLRGPIVSRDGNSIYYAMAGNNGGDSIFTLKYNSGGTFQWNRVFNGGGAYGNNSPGAVKLDKYDNIYVCGVSGFQTTGDDFVTIKYSPSGVQQWVMTYTGIITNGGEGASDLLIDTALKVYVIGSSPNFPGGRATVTIKYNQLVGIVSNNGDIPQEFKLYQNYPNPFNQLSIINYQLSISSNVTMRVYDVLGNEVAVLVNDKQRAGIYQVDFDAANLSSGVYFYQLITENFTQTNKLILLK